MVWKTGFQSLSRVIPKTQKWYLMPPCLTLNVFRYGSRVKWSNSGNRVALSPTSQWSSYWKGSLRVTVDCSPQLYLFIHVRYNKTLILSVFFKVQCRARAFLNLQVMRKNKYYSTTLTYGMLVKGLNSKFSFSLTGCSINWKEKSWIHAFTFTQTQTHIYMYMCVCVCAYNQSCDQVLPQCCEKHERNKKNY